MAPQEDEAQVEEVIDEEILDDSVDMAAWPGNDPGTVAEVNKEIQEESS